MERKLTVLQSVDLFPVAGLKRVLFVLAIGEGHDSSIHFVTDVGPTPSARSLSLRHLPLRDVGQLSLQTGNVVVKVFELGTLNLEIVTIFLITSRDLQVLFLSETRLVAGGFDCNSMLFGSEKTGAWYVDQHSSQV
jgi:actin related protein 2/3 complex subunit 1A/1B